MKQSNINIYMSWKRNNLSISQLYLDPENIRLEAKSKTQEEIIADLFINENALEVLKSIVQNGWFPDETPVVIKEEGKYYVIEGNRRIVSLQAIINPKIVPSSQRKNVEKIIGSISPLRSVDVLIAPNRQSTDKYLASKHTQNTRRPWSALRRAYFYYAQKERGETVTQLIEKYQGVEIPKYIKMYEMHMIAMSLDEISEDVRKNLANKRKFDITTLERLYNNKFFQEQLGVIFDETTGEVSVPTNKKFYHAYARFITDIVQKYITSRKRIDTAENTKAYILEVIDKKIESLEKISAEKLRPKIISEKRKRKYLLPKDMECTLYAAAGVERRLEELQRIDYEDLPNAAVDLLRTFLETLIKKHLQRKGVELPKNGKFAYLEDALKTIKKDVVREGNNEVEQVISRLQNDKKFLDSINHNPSIFAEPIDARNLADKMIELIVYIFDKHKKSENSA